MAYGTVPVVHAVGGLRDTVSTVKPCPEPDTRTCSSSARKRAGQPPWCMGGLGDAISVAKA